MGSWEGSPGLPRFRPRSLWSSLLIVVLHSPQTPETVSSCIVVFHCLLVVPVVQRSPTSTVECPRVEAAMERWRVVRKGVSKGGSDDAGWWTAYEVASVRTNWSISPSRMAAWGCWKQSRRSLGVTHGAAVVVKASQPASFRRAWGCKALRPSQPRAMNPPRESPQTPNQCCVPSFS